MGKNIYFLGIGGTGMASVAGLAMEAGFDVSGSDQNLYPPMSTMLDNLKIKVFTPYDSKNLQNVSPDLAIITNAVSKNHEEVEKLKELSIPMKSFPQFIGEDLIQNKSPVVITGTHGKTTTSSIIAHLLTHFSLDPTYFIGGMQKSTGRSFYTGKGKHFILEGDEYDTAFFDKNSKFLHYRPEYLIINNIEFDHADIFSNLEEIKKQFFDLLKMVESPSKIIANIDDEGVADVLERAGLTNQVSKVSTQGKQKESYVRLTECGPMDLEEGWRYRINTQKFGELCVKSSMIGAYNGANLCQAIAVFSKILEDSSDKKISKSDIEESIAQFQGVERRLQKLADKDGIEIYEDFAHHPTAVSLVLDSFKKTHPKKRLVACFEPKNASSRRNIFIDAYSKAFQSADLVLLGACPRDLRISEDERMNTSVLKKAVGENKSENFDSNDDLLNYLKNYLKAGDCVVFMSSGSFSDIHKKIVQWLIAK